MSFPGASSGRSKVTPFRSDSNGQTPNGSGPPGTGDGMYRDGRGREKLSSRQLEAVKRSEDTNRQAHEWAKSNLPDQCRMWTASAWLAERYRLKRDPSVEEVMNRLQALGHDRDSLIAKFGQGAFDRSQDWYESRGI